MYNIIIFIVLHDYWLTLILSFLGLDFGHLIKSRSIIWFFQFFMIEYDEKWVEKFWMNKSTLFQIVEKVCGHW